MKKKRAVNSKYKADFKTELKQFADKLKHYVSTDSGGWTVKGFIDIYKNIYTISSDTKIVSKILEIHIFPQILQFADSIGYHIVLAEKQNWYPDLSEELFDEYWQNYGLVSYKGKKITNLRDYLSFKGKSNLWKKVTARILRNNK